jgi:predicted neutral ceramidase superfamily lipid hydrolase
MIKFVEQAFIWETWRITLFLIGIISSGMLMVFLGGKKKSYLVGFIAMVILFHVMIVVDHGFKLWKWCLVIPTGTLLGGYLLFFFSEVIANISPAKPKELIMTGLALLLFLGMATLFLILTLSS